MTDSETREGRRRNEPLRVVDKRAFTPDGERRDPDALAEEHPPLPAAPPASPVSPPNANRAAAPPRGSAAAAPAAEADPVASAHFQNLVLNLARQAAANFGAARHPLTGQIELDIEGGQQMIALLQALRQKTLGNLAEEESELLEGLIGDLQMQYVAVRSKASPKP